MDGVNTQINEKKTVNWRIFVILSIICACLILLVVGFTIGYIFTDKGCMENPLVYGISKMDILNNDSFKCSCNSFKSGTFYFNSERISLKNDLNSNPLFAVP
jgi:uncharacterized membrane protein YvbJ